MEDWGSEMYLMEDLEDLGSVVVYPGPYWYSDRIYGQSKYIAFTEMSN